MNKKTSVALSSVFASAVLTLIKLLVGLITGSIGILSEAAHSLLDLGAAALTLFAVRVGDKPPDKGHPYGHGKVESVSALIETGLLFLTSFIIVFEAVKRLITNQTEIEVTWYAFAVMIISIIIDFSRSKALTKIANETKSQALEADALHFSSDILSSIVVVIGLIFSYFGVNKADALAAISVSIFVLHAGYVLGKRTINVLIDTAPSGLSDEITDIARKTNGVLDVSRIRIRPVGSIVFIDMIIDVARSISFETTKHIVDQLTKKIKEIVPDADITIQTKVIALDNETIIEQVKIIADNHKLSVHDIVVQEQENSKRLITFDVEINAESSFMKAHEIATQLEKIIQKEFGDNVEVYAHIEPLRQNSIKGKSLLLEKQNKIELEIINIVKKIPLAKEIHNINIKSIDSQLFVSFHCGFSNSGTLEQIHTQTSTMEYLIRQKIPEIKKVLIHAEPFLLKDHK